jgi:hypothetical protein
MWENACRNTTARAIPCAEQEELPRVMYMSYQLSHSLNTICGDQVSLGKDILQLRVVLVCELHIVRFLDKDAFFVSFSNAATTSARHAREDFVLFATQIYFETPIDTILNSEPNQISNGHISIHHL